MVETNRQLPDRPQAVLLDCLGTLVRLEPPPARLRMELAYRRIWVSEKAAAAAFRAEVAHYLEHHLEGSDAASLELLRDDCARVMVDALEVERSATGAVREAMLAALRFRPYPDAAAALRALRAAHMRLVVTSNWDCSLPEVLAEAGLLALVDAVVTSAGTGA
ncbi:MAG TPA: HAD family hydrolase, partial [Thermoleophilaceae bacterium]|nr:HAD family hydrolase [Thermoleophilaceae bacterium]